MRAMTLQLLAAAAAVAGLAVAAAVVRPTEPDASTRARIEREIRERDIGFYRSRVDRDPYGATDRAQLARLFLQRARDGGSQADLLRSEELARGSLQLRRDRNGAALAVLASSLLAQHRFGEALDAAERLVGLDGSSVAARAMLGEIQLELGRYDEARLSFGSLVLYRSDPAVAVRYARWEELRGRPAEARRLLRAARDAALELHAMPAEQLAWFQLRLGELALRYERPAEAERELKRGLERSPDDYRLLTALARLELIRERPAEAIAYGERAIGRMLDPSALAVLHDAHVVQGDTPAAEQYARAMAAVVRAQAGPLHREWSMFLLDQGRDVAKVLARAEEEIAARPDVYGWDLLAWARYRAGRLDEAREAMRRALALGTRDPSLGRHADIILGAGSW